MSINRRFSTAPMMELSDSYCRMFWRSLTQKALLYSEMVTTGALLHGDTKRLLHFDKAEHPLALQLGGSSPSDLARCAKLAQDWGYDEVNLNVGCPSDRVQNNMIGACLMAHPQLVADCIKAMQDACELDVTIKHRIGIDDNDSYEALANFVHIVAATGCKTFIVHARKAILQGLSPKENREIPPLRYEVVYQLKQDFPSLEILINGGIQTHQQCQEHLQHVDGVMLGREAYHNPWLLSDVDSNYFGQENPAQTRLQALENYIPYIEQQLAQGIRLQHITRHILGLFHGQAGGRAFRRYISENAHQKEASMNVLYQALEAAGFISA
ncbi:MAG: tRNA dihydrouridine(20/20a) synthase DusA [Venatoribacter sp.]